MKKVIVLIVIVLSGCSIVQDENKIKETKESHKEFENEISIENREEMISHENEMEDVIYSEIENSRE